jgi:hypothetical protein
VKAQRNPHRRVGIWERNQGEKGEHMTKKKGLSVGEMFEKASRYRKAYPEKYGEMEDAEILLTVHAISQEMADELRGTTKVDREMVREPRAKKEKVPREKKKRVMTAKQFEKLMKQERKSALACIPDLNYGRPESEQVSIEDVAYDLADSVLFSHPEIKEYLMSIHVTDIRGAVADNLC